MQLLFSERSPIGGLPDGVIAVTVLKNADDNVEVIASAAGMGTATTLRRHFQRTVGVPPGIYRRTFRT